MEHAGNQPGNGIHHHHGGQFPSGQDIIADGNIIRHDFLQHPFVDAFIMSAKENKVFLFCKLCCHLLPEGLSLRRQVYGPDGFPICRTGFFQYLPVACKNRLRLHQHTGAASIGVIIHLSMFIFRIIPDIQRFHGQNPFFHGTAQYTGLHPLPDHFRKQRHYIKIHHSKSPSSKCTSISPASTSTFKMHWRMAGIRSSLWFSISTT